MSVKSESSWMSPGDCLIVRRHRSYSGHENGMSISQPILAQTSYWQAYLVSAKSPG